MINGALTREAPRVGDVDLAAPLLVLARHGYDDWLAVEQDVFTDTGTPSESARRSRAYLAAFGVV